MIYTKDGRPLSVHGDRVFGSHGRQVAQLRNGKAFDSNGRYVGTLVGDRLIYRSTDSAVISGPFAPSISSPFAVANRVGVAVVGDEPPIDA